jgi:hypothetical protein
MGYAFILVNEVEIARLLRFHPPPVLLADPIFMELRAEGAVNDPILAAGFMGYVEFGPEPLTDPQRAAYDAFLRELRGRAEYFNAPPTGHPAFWIATLDPD